VVSLGNRIVSVYEIDFREAGFDLSFVVLIAWSQAKNVTDEEAKSLEKRKLKIGDWDIRQEDDGCLSYSVKYHADLEELTPERLQEIVHALLDEVIDFDKRQLSQAPSEN
jgi:hypothetical protein